MAIDRRSFLMGATSVAAVKPTPAYAFFPKCSTDGTELLSAACRYPGNRFACIVMTTSGQIIKKIPLRARGHDVTQHRESGQTVIFARRPGTFAATFNVRTNDEPQVLVTPPDRHFYGHGTFSANGSLLFATENDFANARGKIGIYDATNAFNRIGEFDTFGVGPHDILLHPDNETLVIANGGIETHPDLGRTKLNIPTMSPSLSFIDSKTGDLIAQHNLSPERRHLSLRHIAAEPDGTIWFGGQWEGDLVEQSDLIGSVSLDQPPKIIPNTELTATNLQGYIASVDITGDGSYLAASAPRAGVIVYLDTSTRKLVRITRMSDGSGVAPLKENAFAVTSGHGNLKIEKPAIPDSHQKQAKHGFAFDNHLSVLRC